MTGSVVSGGRRVGMDAVAAGAQSGIAGTPAGAAEGEGRGGQALGAPGTPDGLDTRVAPGWVIRQPGRTPTGPLSPAGGAGRRDSGASAGSAATTWLGSAPAGLTGPAPGPARTQAQGSPRSPVPVAQNGL
ncbi:secretion protein, partial [Streptomyces sp. SID5926]|nr:secretion protein [Streptomyces sp. SID5926]